MAQKVIEEFESGAHVEAVVNTTSYNRQEVSVVSSEQQCEGTLVIENIVHGLSRCTTCIVFYALVEQPSAKRSKPERWISEDTTGYVATV